MFFPQESNRASSPTQKSPPPRPAAIKSSLSESSGNSRSLSHADDGLGSDDGAASDGRGGADDEDSTDDGDSSDDAGGSGSCRLLPLGSTFDRCPPRPDTRLSATLLTEADRAGVVPGDQAPASQLAVLSRDTVQACVDAIEPKPGDGDGQTPLPTSTDEESPAPSPGAKAEMRLMYDPVPNAYWNVDPFMFKMRVGPNYTSNKVKEHRKGPAFYNLTTMDFVRTSGGAVSNANTLLGLPPANIPGFPTSPSTSLGEKSAVDAVPATFVVTVSLPMPEGDTLVNVLVFSMADELRQELDWMRQEKGKGTKAGERKEGEEKGGLTVRPATRLLVRWFNEAQDNFKMRSRFKTMAVLEKIETLGLGSFINSFNGKPTLISKSGTFTRHENYVEMAINVHKFSYIARQALYRLIPKFQQFVVNLGFTIEGREDEELPEVLLGGCRLLNFDATNVCVV
mmetsp:Transcript_39692/g.92937  ORF Transcript_39692/g.92937 Transcript_39692/m.92937 type:complete len:454 (-) Transcript_39692:180-1541(-)